MFPNLLLYPDEENPKFEIFARRWIGLGPPQSQNVAPEGWIELWPRQPLQAGNGADARKLHLELANRKVDEYSEEEFEVRPSFLEAVEVLLHPKISRPVRIFRELTGNYQIKFEASFLPRAWIPAKYDVIHVANTLEEAREVAWLFFQGYLDGSIGFYDDSWKTNKLYPLGLTPEGHWPVRGV